jgi:hypothetical protein
MMMASNIFGGAGPIFGRARLPIGEKVFQKSRINAAVSRDRKRLARPAVGTGIVQRFEPNLAPRFGTWHTLGQRLGACFSFDRLPEIHSSWVSGKRLGRSGASPYQCSDGASPLMTNTETFVPYFKYLVIPL